VNKIYIKTEKLRVWNCLEINYISLRPREVKGVEEVKCKNKYHILPERLRVCVMYHRYPQNKKEKRWGKATEKEKFTLSGITTIK
jgi:hypothetical protein